MDSTTESLLHNNSTGFQWNLSESITPSSTGWFPGPSSPYTPLKALVIGFVLSCVIVVTIIGNRYLFDIFTWFDVA